METNEERISVILVESDASLRAFFLAACRASPLIDLVNAHARLSSALAQTQPPSHLVFSAKHDGIEKSIETVKRKWPDTRLLLSAGKEDAPAIGIELAFGIHGCVCCDDPTLENIAHEIVEVLQRGEFLSRRGWKEFASSDLELRARWDSLSDLDRQVAELLREGKQYKEIADALNRTERFVRRHVEQVLRKHGLHRTKEVIPKLVRIQIGQQSWMRGGQF